MNIEYRKQLAGTGLDYFDTREAIDSISPGAYDKLPYTSRALAEQLVRRCEPENLEDSLKQIIDRKQDLDFPWYPARVVCHDILGQTALVDLAGTVLFLVPFCIFILIIAWPYVANSWKLLESSREAGGLPMVFLLKSLMMVMPVLLLGQSFINVTDAWNCLRKNNPPHE